ncbi:hypothetical protein F2P81_024208 [Scophthalmus maximus]|uniref:Calponin-homology (CH) domain-containing protein n=1 Tax=Scophthalmus maximus TaxID=52904 RepID=A0A6A4RU67_SCOMX|nr:hypothetical protein F2P81_024208 [Scophthalmus maximus]
MATHGGDAEGGTNEEFNDIIRWRSDEHDAVQRKTFTKWINAQYSKTGKTPIKDMFSDLRDGRKLLDLLEGLTGTVLTKERGSTRVHSLNNVNKVLQVLHQNNVDLVNIGGTDIVDGNHKLTLGLIWSIILHWQVKDIMKDIMSNLQQTNSEKILLSWVRQCSRSYPEVNVLNFTTSWADGLAFNSILHHFRPNAFSWDQVVGLSPVERLDHAFSVAKEQLAIERLLDPEDVAVQLPDKKSIIMYVTSLFAVLPKDVSMEAIREVETLPRKFKAEAVDSGPGRGAQSVQMEEAGSSPRPETPSTLTEAEGEMEGSLLEVDLDSYQTTLEEVLTWLLSAEDALQIQDEVSDDVEEVKDQFHTHEAFMMELTAHQSSVGNVLQAGNQLIAQGNLTEEEEDEIREQMSLLNSRWESLRVASMDRQARLHEVLMDLQQQQLQQLSDWLTQTEARIRKIETEPAAKDVEVYKELIEQHKELQNDLEAEQVKVNSLTHMVVVVDENSGESATAALEEQLQSLGERWAAVCRWTEERWQKLQEVFMVWQQLLSDQSLFREWLAEKEEALSEVQTSNFKDPSEMNTNVRRLAILKEDMEKKRRTLDQLSDAGQDVISLLRSPEAGATIEADTEDLAHRWDNLVQRLEDCSFQLWLILISPILSHALTAKVMEAVTDAGMTQVEEDVVVDAVAVAAAAAASISDQELAPPAPPKKRLLETDAEVRRMFENKLSDLLTWIQTCKATAQALASSHPETSPENPDLQEKLKGLEMDLTAKEATVSHVIEEGRVLMDQLEREGECVDTVRADIGLIQTEWDVCARELGAARERVHTQTRVSAVSAELRDLDRVLKEQDRWLDSNLAAEKCDEAELRNLSGECQVTALSPRLERLSAEAGSLGAVPSLNDNMVVASAHYASTLQRLQSRGQEVNDALAPPEVDQMAPCPVEALEARLATLREGMTDVPATEGAVERAQEVWSCWMELLQYLDMEQSWLNTLEEKVQATDNLSESTEAVSEALESLESVLRHPGDNRTQIKELGQTLIDGGILDELISEKLESFNSRYEQLNHQAVNRQISLEQQLQTLKENEQALQALQESLSQLDHTLTSYLTDRVDAFQLPQEAQTIGTEIAAHEVTVEEMRRRNVANLPAAATDGKAARGGTMLDHLQRKLREISTKYQLFQKPANFEQRMLDCKRVLEGAKAELHILDIKDVEPEKIQPHLSGCMKLYKLLSEVKLEVETVIKTGRQIVQKQQTESPKAMDEQLTALKMLYNDLGAQVTEGKQDLEKALSLSQKFAKESSALQEWLSTNEAPLQQKNSCGDMPADIDAEIAWANGLLKESERRKAELSSLMETSAGLQTLVEGSEAELEDKLFGLNESWGRVRTWTEDWLSTVLSHQNEVEIFDENVAHISTWLYQTQIHLDEAERFTLSEREKVVKRMLEELEDIGLRVDNVRDQAIILMTSRGPACRDVVEPKLAELNCNFDKVSQHIKTAQMMTSLESGGIEMNQQVFHNQEIQVESQSQARPVEALVSSEVKDLQVELRDTLRALQQQQQDPENILDDDKMDEEKASVEELLRRGEESLQRTSDEGQREELRLLLLRLQSQYSAHRELTVLRMSQVQVSVESSSSYTVTELTKEFSAEEMSAVERSSAPSLSCSDYLLDINKLLLTMADNELLLNSSELSGGLYEDFSSQEDTLKNIKSNLDLLVEQVTGIHERQPDAIRDASPAEVTQIGDALTQLNAEWDRLNRMYNHRKGSFDRAIEEWGQFHCDMNDLSLWLTDTETLLSESVSPDGQLDLDSARQHQEELEEGLASHQPVLAVLNRTGEQIIGQLSSLEGPLLEEKLDGLGQRWRAVNRRVLDRQRRLVGEDPALSELVRRRTELAVWLEQAEHAVSSLPATATDKNLKELKVTHELLDNVGVVEANLQSHAQFRDRMDRLTDWVVVTHQTIVTRGLNPVQAQSKVEELAADWKALDGRIRESLQPPISPWTQHHVVQHQQLVSSVPSAVQMASLVSEDPHHQTPHTADTVAPTDLNETATELADWLLLITQMLKSNIVTVGDTEEIRTTMGRLQVTKNDLEQRHPQLEDIFTLAQNIKNKTSNLDVRTSITEKLEKVRSQWDNTQHGVEARLQQLDNMTVHSNQWEEQRKEVKALIGLNEGRFHNLLQQSRDPLTKQLSDNKCHDDPNATEFAASQAFLQDLGRGQGAVAAFNELSNHLLREYSTDDTRRIKEVTDKRNASWNSINNRASDRYAQLDSELKGLQMSLRELESFLKWLQEAETTVNVLADASQREDLTQDSAHGKELKHQLEIFCSSFSFSFTLPFSALDLLKVTEVLDPAVREHLFVFRQQTWPELSNSSDIMIYGRACPSWITPESRQDRDYGVLRSQWTRGKYTL